MGKLGLYLHVPFCVRKCHYCDFYSAPADKGARTAYVRALCRHLAASGSDRTVDTVYFGGGTPTLLDTEDFQAVLDTVRAHFNLEAGAEITAECNPVTHADGMMEGLRRAGVDRLSIGLQSANEGELKLLGRPHGYAEFLETYHAARRAGFDNISVDLMFGIPDQTVESFAYTIDTLLALSPEHISAYGLRIEEGTPLDGMRKRLVFPNEDAEAEMAELVASRLTAAGYEHYEISNYAKAGKRSRHNMRYWLGEDYLGFGPGAHSYMDGVRFFTASDTAAYLAAVESGDLASLRQGAQRIAGKELQDEYVMLRMRLFDGIDLADFAHRFGISFEDAYGDTDRLAAAGFLQKNKERIAFSEKGMRVSNAILSEWLDFGEGGEA
ncbi:MAG: radical SAM family heme chaperone HemW [Ruminococcaceae bacterium]|nr:radical SAM family heme chaperone HemW [Oscillospiraceae bacterium]